MNKIVKVKWFMLLAVLTLAWGCSSDSDGDGSQEGLQLLSGTDERPTWKVPDYNLYEQTMSVQLRLQDELAAYVTEQDLMCAMIDGEVRALHAPEITDAEIYFPLTVGTNNSDVMVSISYYCDRLHRIYTFPDWHEFDASLPPLDSEDKPYLIRFFTTE
ncbi:MAG: hypothetical protein IKQ62_08370 [Bacteroidaceae bacterium]|nr:hypothetical protein [Bacteroidaceae bacterium]